MKKIFLMLLCIVTTISYAQIPPQVPIAKQWHFEGNHPAPNMPLPTPPHGWDWVFSILPTAKKEYICCGYTADAFWNGINAYSARTQAVIFKLNNLGKLVWIKKVHENGIYDEQSGSLFQVIKTPNGYAACGYMQAPGQSRKPMIVEVNEDGQYTSQLYPKIFDLPQTYTSTFSQLTSFKAGAVRSIAMSPNGGEFVIAGDAFYGQYPLVGKAYITTINYSTLIVNNPYVDGGEYHNLTGGFVSDDVAGGNRFSKVLTKSTGTNTYDIYACGYKSMAGDGTEITLTNIDGYTESLYTMNKDMWVLKTTNSLPVTPTFSKLFKKSDFPGNGAVLLENAAKGSLTARGMLTDNYNSAHQVSYPEIRNNLNASVNQDERATDMLIDANGNLVVIGLENFVSVGNSTSNSSNGDRIFHTTSAGAVPDYLHTNYSYHSLFDGDAFLLNITPAGTLTWAKNVAHFSSRDFIPRIVEKGTNIIIAASVSDFYDPNNNLFDDLTTPIWYDGYIMSTPNTPTGATNWRRNFHDVGEIGHCNFALAKTEDGGIVVGGDNDRENTNFTITKFASPCMPAITNYMADQSDGIPGDGKIELTGTVNWTNATHHIKSRIIVKSGATLNISGSTVNFASTDNIYDYELSTLQNDPNPGVPPIGIEVEPGGTLNVTNSTLQSITTCSGERHMWDGITVRGNSNDQALNGKVIMSNSIINDAHIGVAVGKFNRNLGETVALTNNFQVVNKTWSTLPYQYIYWEGGGLITANTCTLRNCYLGVQFSQFLVNNQGSAFTNCQFISDLQGMGEACYYTDWAGNKAPSKYHATLFNVKNITFKDNTFSGYDFRNGTVGIWSVNSGFTATRSCTTAGCGNTFLNLNHGISVRNTPLSSSVPITITYNNFNNNFVGTKIEGAWNSATVKKNTFEIPKGNAIVTQVGNTFMVNDGLSNSYYNPMGLYLLNCRGYAVNDENTFKNVSTNMMYPLNWTDKKRIGILVNNQYPGDEKVNNNDFSNVWFGAIAHRENGNNSVGQATGLQFRCNRFKNQTKYGISRIYYIHEFTPFGNSWIRPAQGAFALNSRANNQFFNSCFYNGHLHADGGVSQQVIYVSGGVQNTPIGTCHSPLYTLFQLGNNTAPNCGPTANNKTAMYDELKTYDEEISRMKPEDEGYGDMLTERSLLVNDLALLHNGQENDPKTAGELLEYYGKHEEALSMFASAGMWSAATRSLASLPLNNDEEKLYSWLLEKGIYLYSRDSNWTDLDSTDVDSLTRLVQVDNYAATFGGAIAEQLGVGRIEWPLPIFDTTFVLPDSTDTTEYPDTLSAIRQYRPETTPPDISILQSDPPTKFNLYPNPSSGNFIVECHTTGAIDICSIDGRTIATYSVKAGKTEIVLPPGLSGGIYMIKCIPDDGTKPKAVRLVYQP